MNIYDQPSYTVVHHNQNTVKENTQINTHGTRRKVEISQNALRLEN